MFHNQTLKWELIEEVFFSSFMVIAGNNGIAETMLNSNFMSRLHLLTNFKENNEFK